MDDLQDENTLQSLQIADLQDLQIPVKYATKYVNWKWMRTQWIHLRYYENFKFPVCPIQKI